MNILKKLFQSSYKKKEPEPDNKKLFKLIEQYISDNEYESYKKVVFELENGNSYLLIPSDHSLGEEFSSWTPSPGGLKIMMGIWFRDGLKETVAFTSEEALFVWNKAKTRYVSITSQAFLKWCETNGFERIIIDSGQRTMIVLQK